MSFAPGDGIEAPIYPPRIRRWRRNGTFGPVPGPFGTGWLEGPEVGLEEACHGGGRQMATVDVDGQAGPGLWEQSGRAAWGVSGGSRRWPCRWRWWASSRWLAERPQPLALPPRTPRRGPETTIYSDRVLASPNRMVAGPDGAMWFTNLSGNSIGRITTAGMVTNFTGTALVGPATITAGPDGVRWFTNRRGNSIGRITTAGVVTSYTGTGMSGPRWYRSRARSGPLVRQQHPRRFDRADDHRGPGYQHLPGRWCQPVHDRSRPRRGHVVRPVPQQRDRSHHHGRDPHHGPLHPRLRYPSEWVTINGCTLWDLQGAFNDAAGPLQSLTQHARRPAPKLSG